MSHAAQSSFRFSAEVRSLLDLVSKRTGMARTKILVRLIRAEAVRIARLDAVVIAAAAKVEKRRSEAAKKS